MVNPVLIYLHCHLFDCAHLELLLGGRLRRVGRDDGDDGLHDDVEEHTVHVLPDLALVQKNDWR